LDMTSPRILQSLQKKIWQGRVPLEIRLANDDCRTYDKSESYICFAHRISYLPLLIPRLVAFFRSSLIHEADPSQVWFSFEEVPLKWHYPIGLLFDLYSPVKDELIIASGAGRLDVDETEESDNGLPWQLIVHFSGWPEEQLIKLDKEGKELHDKFNNSVKEASYIRHGTNKIIMSLGKEPTTQLWEAVETVDPALFYKVHRKLVRPAGESIRNIPIKIYLPAPASDEQGTNQPGHLRIVQLLITPTIASSRQPQTLGTALNTFMFDLFPSRRSPVKGAYPVLHGSIVPLSVVLDELAEWASYADGFIHLVVALSG